MLLVLSLAHCSCQRAPEAAQAGPADTLAAPAAQQPPPEGGGEPGAAPAAAASRHAAAADAGSTLHAYLAALPGEPARADAFWAGGRPDAPADDAVLRRVGDLRAMRVENGPPQALDREWPPRAFEIPVRLRLDGDGPRRIHGWYRLRARVTGGWEITSASLQPELD